MQLHWVMRRTTSEAVRDNPGAFRALSWLRRVHVLRARDGRGYTAFLGVPRNAF